MALISKGESSDHYNYWYKFTPPKQNTQWSHNLNIIRIKVVVILHYIGIHGAFTCGHQAINNISNNHILKP